MRVIIDCTEVFIQRPKKLFLHAQTWSNYKHNKHKFLICIKQAGLICFLSKACGGTASDKYIVQESGFYDKLEYGDNVLSDHGFTIAEEVADHHASLATPVFTHGNSPLPGQHVELKRKLARARIHVERAIHSGNSKILSTTMPICILPYATYMCCHCLPE